MLHATLFFIPYFCHKIQVLSVDSGQGRVGLCKWVGDDKAPAYQHVAIKSSLSEHLDNEAAAHWAIHQAGSSHILGLIKEPIKRTDEDDPIDGDEPHVRHLLMEYCSLGDLQKLIVRRKKM